MNPETKKTDQPSQPDYSFIVNQPMATDSNKPKKLDRKLIVIIVLVVLMAIIIGVGALLRTNSNVEKTQDNALTPAQQEASKDTIHSFFAFVEANKVDDAYALFATDTPLDEEIFKAGSVPLAQKLKLNECQPKEEIKSLIDEQGRLVIAYTCHSKADNLQIDLEFTLDSADDGTLTIYYYDLADES